MQFDTTYYTNEYDPYADFPAYFNPLSLANSLVAVFYVHPDKYYDTITGSTTTTVVPNSAGVRTHTSSSITRMVRCRCSSRFGTFRVR